MHARGDWFKLLVLSFILCSFSPSAFAQMYLGLDWNFGVVMSDSDYNNGASAGAPGFSVGVKMGRFSPEIFYKRYSFEQEAVNGDLGLLDTKIRSNSLGAGILIDHHPNIYSKFGLAFHMVEAKYTKVGSSRVYESAIDKTWASPYFGGGLNFPFNQNFSLFTDLVFYLSGAEFSVFNWAFGLRYLLP